MNKLFETLLANLKNPKLYIGLLIILIVFVFLFPYIDANFFYHKRIANRVEVLSTISSLDMNEIEQNDILKEEYTSILEEIGKQKDDSFSSIFYQTSDPNIQLFKFISGGLLFWILAISCIFMSTFESNKIKFLGIVLCTAIGFLSGSFARALPIVIKPIVNYVGFPLILLIIIGILATSSTKSEKNN